MSNKLTRTETIEMMVEYLNGRNFHFLGIEENDDFYIWDKRSGLYIPTAEKKVNRELIKNYGAEATISLIKEVVNQLKYKKLIKLEELNPPHLLGVNNGVIDITTREFFPTSPDNYITRKINVEYNPFNTTCLRIHKFIESIVDKENVELMYELIAYCLYNGYPLQNFFILYGTGRNGKSVFLKLLTQFLGDGNVSNIDIHSIINDKFATSSLYGKMANVYGDLSDTALKETGKLKDITGDSKIEAQRKFGHSFTFWNTCKLIYACNRIPRAYDNTDAFHRRVIIIDFPNQFDGDKADPYILDKITDATELSGLLNICLEKIDKILERGFDYTEDINKRRKMYSFRSDSMESFLSEDVLEIFPNDSSIMLKKEDIYKLYLDFCSEKRFTPDIDKVFWKRWASLTFGTSEKRLTKDGIQNRWILGVGIKTYKDEKV